MAPVLAVIFVSGYGFVVWMYQLIAGPPGQLMRDDRRTAYHQPGRAFDAASASRACPI